MKTLAEHRIYLILILFFSMLGMKALFHPGLFTAHDIWHQVVRLYYYYQGINDGQFLPTWVGQLANGFGYPLFLFSYHLPWLIGVPFLKIGLDIPTVLKTLFFLSYIGSGLTMYFFVNNLLKNKLSAILSSILYLWLPYHFLIIFVGGSIGIAFVFTFLPLVFLGINLTREESKLGPAALALGLSGITLSHIMHLIFLSPIILIFLLWSFAHTKKRVNFFKNIFFGIMLSALISSFYLIPAAYYNQFTRAHQETGFYELYKRNFVNFNQIVYSKWGYSPIVNNAKNGEVSFQLGFAQWISIVSLIVLIIIKKLTGRNKSLSMLLLLGFAISIFLMLDYSSFFWKSAVKPFTLDFPFRLLLPAAFIASIFAGIVLASTAKKAQGLILIFLTIIALYTNRNHININQYTNFPISTYLNIETEITTNTYNEYLPKLANTKLLNKPWNEAVGDNLSVSDVKHTTNSLSFNLNSSKAENISTGQFYFPGQNLYLDNKLIQSDIDKEGRISFLTPPGQHSILIKYQETTLIKASKFLTIIGIFLLFLPFLKNIQLLKKKLRS